MRKIWFVTLTFVTMAQSNPYVNTDIVNECETIEQKLNKVDRFIKAVEMTSAFHLEEVAVAMVVPEITKSNNKRRMLRDAAKRKAGLEEDKKLCYKGTEA